MEDEMMIDLNVILGSAEIRRLGWRMLNATDWVEDFETTRYDRHGAVVSRKVEAGPCVLRCPLPDPPPWWAFWRKPEPPFDPRQFS